MQIVKTERIELSKNEYEAFELVARIADRLQYASSHPNIIKNSEELENAIDNILEYCVPYFGKEDN